MKEIVKIAKNMSHIPYKKIKADDKDVKEIFGKADKKYPEYPKAKYIQSLEKLKDKLVKTVSNNAFETSDEEKYRLKDAIMVEFDNVLYGDKK